MSCPYLEFVSVYVKKCKAAKGKTVPEEYRKVYCNFSGGKKTPGYKECPYYKKRGVGF